MRPSGPRLCSRNSPTSRPRTDERHDDDVGRGARARWRRAGRLPTPDPAKRFAGPRRGEQLTRTPVAAPAIPGAPSAEGGRPIEHRAAPSISPPSRGRPGRDHLPSGADALAPPGGPPVNSTRRRPHAHQRAQNRTMASPSVRPHDLQERLTLRRMTTTSGAAPEQRGPCKLTARTSTASTVVVADSHALSFEVLGSKYRKRDSLQVALGSRRELVGSSVAHRRDPGRMRRRAHAGAGAGQHVNYGRRRSQVRKLEPCRPPRPSPHPRRPP